MIWDLFACLLHLGKKKKSRKIVEKKEISHLSFMLFCGFHLLYIYFLLAAGKKDLFFICSKIT